MVNHKEASDKAVRVVYDVLQDYRDINPNMSVSQIMAFLNVVINEGSSLKELAENMGMKIPTMSRILIDIGFRNRHMEPGLNLVESRQDPLELRKNQYTVSKRGHYLVDKLVKKLGL